MTSLRARSIDEREARGWRLWPIVRTMRFRASGWSRLRGDLGPEQFCGEHYVAWSDGRWFPRWCRACRRVRRDTPASLRGQDLTRFERDFARLQRAMEEARAEGMDDGHIAGAINMAAAGRADRRQALAHVVQRLGATKGADDGAS